MFGAQAIVKEIIAKPFDDEPRLIYADWLEEHGEVARAEFIRLQCELATMEYWQLGRERLNLESQAILSKHEDVWKKQLGIKSRLYFRRGLIEQMTVTGKTLLAMEPSVFANTPIMSVSMNRVNDRLDAIRDSKILNSVLGFKVSGNLTEPHLLEVLKMLSRKNRKLDLSGSQLSFNTDLARAIGEAPFAKHLTEFYARACEVPASFFETLAESGGLPKLRRLEFGGGFEKALPAHFENMKLGKVRELKVGGKLRVVDCRELCFLPLKKLTSLSLRGTRPPAAGLKLMLDAGAFRSAERINLGTCNLSRATIELILNTRAPKCTHLNLANNQKIDNETVGRILGQRAFPKLRAINLTETSVSLSPEFIANSPVSIFQ